MRLFRLPGIFYFLFHRFLWHIPVKDKTLFLTIDDGPSGELTLWILDVLDKYHAKATFFCVGENILNHRDCFEKILAKGHLTANHTFSHDDFRDVSHTTYLHSIQKCGELVNSRLFRPPYGRVASRLAKMIIKAGFIPVMWSVLSYDYDQELTPGKILRKIVKRTKPGSIIVFHDNLKAKRNIQIILPRYLAFFTNKGYKFKVLPHQLNT